MTDAQNSRKQRPQRGPGRPWQPGQSGNPGGRPKESKTFRAWCRETMEQFGCAAILRIARTARDERVRLNAWRLLAEYAYGRPTIALETPEPMPQTRDEGVGRVARMIDLMAERLQGVFMRRVVRDYITAALHRQRAQIEAYIAEHLKYPDAFPLALGHPTVSMREIGGVWIVPQLDADYPAVAVVSKMHVAVYATSARREAARGIRTAAVPDALLGAHTFGMDVKLEVIGTPMARGYELEPRSPALLAWWG